MPSLRTVAVAVPLLLTAISAQATSMFLGCTDPLATPFNPAVVYAESASACADACALKTGKSSFAYYHPASRDGCVCSAHGPGDVYDISYPEAGASHCADYEVAIFATYSGNSFTSQPRFKRHLERLQQRQADLDARDGQADCPSPLQACKVKGDDSAFQCIDPQYAIDSCGGCINGAFGAASSSPAVDCTSLPGVPAGGAICSLGQCKAYRCEDGYKLDGNTCVKA
ncbi:hypothetical protein IAU60_003509 [Kwoniella sp. DSM 27419]